MNDDWPPKPYMLSGSIYLDTEEQARLVLAILRDGLGSHYFTLHHLERQDDGAVLDRKVEA